MNTGYPYQTTHYYVDGHIKNNSTGTSFQPYLYSGKDLDQETGYYYYGARYYDPGTVLWFGTDPLAHKYPMNSPYVYCNGNPVRYVDPDGRWPWENRNIRDARAFASQNGFEVQLIDGKYGKDAVVVKDGNVVTTYSARLSGQKIWYDNLDDHHNDCANLGTTTTSDVRAVADLCEGVSDACDAVGTGLLITGVGAAAGGVLYKAGTIAGSVSDAINIGVDLYERKYENAVNRIVSGISSEIFSHKIHTGNGKADNFAKKAFDKITDTIISVTIK